MKIHLNSAKENWVVDRFREEWYKYNSSISTKIIRNSDIVWIISPWTWKKINKKILSKKKVICSIYHLDEDKFDEKQLDEFNLRDEYVDFYHVISENTKKQIKKLTNKPIVSIPFWVNQEIWKDINEKDILREKYKLDLDSYLIGSFQRDTEGKDLISPKLSKGPDQFIKIIKEYKEKNKKIGVILAGKRRNFIIENLERLDIPFNYFEMVDFKELNELYNCLDLYIVSSRYEGGPQAVMECAITRTPIISTDVGVASEILHPNSIFSMNSFMNAKPNTDYAYEKVQKYLIPNGFENFRKIINQVYEN
tara:strand:+ start:1222 stop:2145 length:924 start_codon:yes stop_codon:yes gene_type:complete